MRAGRMIRLRIRRFLVVASALALLFALASAASACGGMWDMRQMHDRTHGIGSQAPQTPVVADATQITVEIRDFDFSPRDLTVDAGTEVTWVNRDSVPHDATDEKGAWSTGMLKQGASATLTVDSPGTFRDLCTIHPNMKATLTVIEERL